MVRWLVCRRQGGCSSREFLLRNVDETKTMDVSSEQRSNTRSNLTVVPGNACALKQVCRGRRSVGRTVSKRWKPGRGLAPTVTTQLNKLQTVWMSWTLLVCEAMEAQAAAGGGGEKAFRHVQWARRCKTFGVSGKGGVSPRMFTWSSCGCACPGRGK